MLWTRLKNSALWIIVQYKYVAREMSHESCTKIVFFMEVTFDQNNNNF